MSGKRLTIQKFEAIKALLDEMADAPNRKNLIAASIGCSAETVRRVENGQHRLCGPKLRVVHKTNRKHLTIDEAAELYEFGQNKDFSTADLATTFDVSASTVNRVLSGRHPKLPKDSKPGDSQKGVDERIRKLVKEATPVREEAETDWMLLLLAGLLGSAVTLAATNILATIH